MAGDAMSCPPADTESARGHETFTERASAFWLAANTALGRGLTSREAHATWERFGVGERPNRFPNVQTLLRTGHLRALAAVGRETVYVHRDAAPEHQVVGIQPSERVLGLLIGEVASRGAPVPTAVVTLAVTADGAGLSPSRIALILEQLAQDSPVEFRNERWSVTTIPVYLVGGKRRKHWWAARADDPAPPPAIAQVASYRQAVIDTVERARLALGVPPTRAEWELFVATLDPTRDDAARLIGEDTGFNRFRVATLKNMSAAHRARVDVQGLAHVTSAQAFATSADWRFGLPGGGLAITPGIRALEALGVLRPELEIAGLHTLADVLAERRGLTGSATFAEDGALQRVRDMREKLLAQALVDVMPLDAWPAALTGAARHVAVLDQWLASAPRTYYQRYRFGNRFTEGPAASIRALSEWLALHGDGMCCSIDSEAGRLRTAPTDGGADMALLRAIYDLRFAGDLRSPDLPWVFRHTRRAVAPVANGETATTRRQIGRDQAYVRDRVDAWGVVFADAGADSAWLLVAEARRLLGHVLRDATFVRAVQDGLSARSSDLRQALVVARGLLGDAPDDAELDAARTTADARALLLSCLLAAPADPRSALRRLGAAWRGRAPLVALVSHAWERVRSEEPLHVIEN